MKRFSFPTRLADARIPQLSAAMRDYRNASGDAESVARLSDRLAQPLAAAQPARPAASSGWLFGVALAASGAGLVLYLASVEPARPAARAAAQRAERAEMASVLASGVGADPRELASEAPGAVLQAIVKHRSH